MGPKFRREPVREALYVTDLDRRICVAPMMGWTDRHERFFLRQMSRRALLFSEMLSPEAIVLGKKEYYLGYHPQEHPVVFQLGGNQPEMLAAACRELELVGFDEINFNVGCPSQGGHTQPYGAHLMKTPQVVVDCLSAMREAVSIPVTIKTRIGIDREDSYQPLADFVGKVQESGCRVFTIHARKAWLDGLSPKQNRDIPPLRYEYVYRLKREFPHLTVVLNGGITEWSEAAAHLEHVDGVMVGRRAYKDPYWLATVDRDFFGCVQPIPSKAEVLRRCIPYVEEELAQGTALRDIARHMMGLYRNVRAVTAFRRHISVNANEDRADLGTFLEMIDIAENLAA